MRRAILSVSSEFITEFLKSVKKPAPKFRYIRAVENILPSDVEVVALHPGMSAGTIEILLESELFDDVREGKKYPYLLSPVLQVEYVEDNDNEWSDK